MENASSTSSEKLPDSSNVRLLVGTLWIVSLLVVGIVGFVLGQGNKPQVKADTEGKNVLSAMYGVSTTPTPPPTSTPPVTESTTCTKTGLAQKWDYLTSYVIKEGDSVQSIVSTELKDEGRVNEVMKLNDSTQLVVGSTLYLPPKIISKSTGNIKLVHGKLIEKNPSSWYLSFGGDEKGRGILIPSFWFDGIQNKDTFNVNDCLSILLDDGFKVFSVTRQ